MQVWFVCSDCTNKSKQKGTKKLFLKTCRVFSVDEEACIFAHDGENYAFALKMKADS